MNITTAHTHTPSRALARRSPQLSQENSHVPSDNVTLRMSRSSKRKLVTGVSIAAGAALGGYVTANTTSALTGTAAKVMGGVAGLAAGAAVVGVAGGLLAGALTKDEGFGGLAGAYGGLLIGGVVGGVGGAIGGAMLGTGAGNVLGYAGGILLGGTVGAFAAAGINK